MYGRHVKEVFIMEIKKEKDTVMEVHKQKERKIHKKLLVMICKPWKK